MITNTDNVVNTRNPSISRHFPDYERNCHSNTNHVERQSIDDRLHQLAGKIPGLHRDGKYLEAPCPKCGGHDRFFAGSVTNYSLFTCHSCGHKQHFGAWSVEATPAVKPWQPTAEQPGRVDAIREIYTSLSTFAQFHLHNAAEYLAGRGLVDSQLSFDGTGADLTLAHSAGIGYIDAGLYRQWFAGLDAGQRAAAEWAGLPDGSKGRLTGHGAMFAGGHKGKVLFPYYNDAGAVVDIRTRSISGKDTVNGKPIRYTSPKGTNADRGIDAPYGLHLLPSNAPRIVLTEGEFKAIAANLLAGVPAVGLRGVNDWAPEYLDIFRGRLVILAFDDDNAGAVATVQIGRLLSAHSIDCVVLDPALLGASKGLDDYILASGGPAFAALVKPASLVTLAEYEHRIKERIDLRKIKAARADVGTIRQWTPESEIGAFAHAGGDSVTVDEAVELIRSEVNNHLGNYKRGHDQLLITAPAGVGKTFTAINEVLAHAGANDQTVAVILPNHDTIDEKISEGLLAGFRHVYGHNDDNCKQNDQVGALVRKGYSPGRVICPKCPFADWCKDFGYKSQFTEPENRAYVHAHAFTDYPDGEDIVIADELSHKAFVGEMRVFQSDLSSVLAQGGILQEQAKLFKALLQMWSTEGLRDLAGATFYEVLERYYPGLRDVDAWGDGSHVQGALFDVADKFLSGDTIKAEDLPQQFGTKLFALLSEDVRRLNAGQPVTGRVRFVSVSSISKWIELSYSKGGLPRWYNRRPTIILNATADAEIMQDLCGPLRVVAPRVAVADGNEVIQDITYNNAKSAYLGASDEAGRRRGAWLDAIRSHIAAHAGGEADTTIIVAKALEKFVIEAFPTAKVAYYHALEGRNDLQSGLTILASSVPVNIPAVLREASALYPGVNTALARSTVAFDEANAGGEWLAVEQIDAVDPRVAGVLAQHRDAAAVQAVHRSRIVRKSGRRVVVMFSRPIPGLAPSKTVTDRPSGADKRAAKKVATIDRLVTVASDLIGEEGGFVVDLLTSGAEVSINTAKKYLPEICTQLGLYRLALPVIQTINNGAKQQREITLVLAPNVVDTIKMHVDHERYNISRITNVIHVHLAKFLPQSWVIDVESLIATLTPKPKEEPAAAPLPGRWNAATNAQALKAELLKAKAGSLEKQNAAKHLIAFLNGTSGSLGDARLAMYELGIGYLIDFAKMVTI